MCERLRPRAAAARSSSFGALTLILACWGAPATASATDPFGGSRGTGRAAPAIAAAARAEGGSASNERGEAPAAGLRQQVAVDLVLVPVSVFDAEGRPVRDLAREDFILHDGASRREIRTFDRGDVPASLVLALDCSGSVAPIFPVVKAASIQFVQALSPNVSVSLLPFAETAGPPSPFTLERAPVYYEIHQRKATGSETSLFAALGVAVRLLRSQRGRRAAVLFTDGFDTVVEEADEERVTSRLLAEARAAAVSVFSILYGRPREQTWLAAIAEGTGGEALTPSSGRRLTESFERIARLLSAEYTLGFEPTGSGRPGEWRSLRVEVRRPGLTVHARSGYSTPGSPPR